MPESIGLGLKGDMTHGLAPEPMSEACARYFTEQTRLYMFQQFLLGVVKSADLPRLAAFHLRLELAKSDEERTEAAKEGSGVMKAFQTYENFSDVICEMWLCRIVDNYLAYVSELLALVFSTKPGTLKSRENITLEEVLSYETIADLVAVIAERKIHQLSYQGISELSDHLKDRLGFPLFEDLNELSDARMCVEARNIVVHNRGIVGRISAARLPSLAPFTGARIRITHEDAIRAAATFARSVNDLEIRASGKFGIPQSVPDRMAMIRSFYNRGEASAKAGKR